MKLVSIEIKGFKSFADKTLINFNENITGVVGPNGCGKSNVVDALRWVLGEQKTSALRSEKMENVIFNGTRKRKPSALAEVFLTFENNRALLPTEYNTVTISRHYYRTGESEYRLNNVNCRLKDITNLFLDTGIGSDSYAIIELGMVNDLLNDKDNSRRKLFEQAAGISKYKTRKKETLSKLDATQADLNRVEDLLFEIDNNLKQLESQARKTERYHKLKDEYKVLSIELALFTLKDFKETFDALQQQQEAESEAKLITETEIQTVEAKLQEIKAEFLEKEKELMSSQRALNEATQLAQAKENEKNLLQENIKHTNEKIQSLGQQNEQLANQLAQAETSIGLFTEQRLAEQEISGAFKSDLEAAGLEVERVKVQHTETRRALDVANAALRAVENESVELEKKATVLRVQKESLAREIRLGEEEHGQRSQEKEKLLQAIDELNYQENAEKEQLADLARQADQIQLDINRLEEETATLRDNLNETHRKLDARRNEYNLTKSFIENMEGFPESIKFLKNNNQWNKKAPLVSDVISASDNYRVAIESYLEPYLNYYVVNDMQEAMQAVNLLSSAAKGRANFFVLNDFENESLNGTPQVEGSTKAIDVVDYDAQYDKLVHYLLRKVYITENEPAAQSDGNIFIARSGKFVRTKHAVTGGQVGAASGKRLGRVRNLEALSKEIETLTAEAETRKQELFTKQAGLVQLRNNSNDPRIDRMREQHNNTRQKLTAARTRLETIETFFTNYLTRTSAFTDRGTGIDADLVNIQDQLEQVQQRLGDAKTATDAAAETFRQADLTLANATQTYNAANIRFLQQENKINSIQQQIEFRRQQADDTRAHIERNTASSETSRQQLIDVESKLAEAEAQLVMLYEEKTRKEQTVADADRAYYETRGVITELEENSKNLARRREQSSAILQGIHDRINELRLQLSSTKERMQLEFKVNIEELLEQTPNPDVDAEELKSKTEKMRARLDNYGEINPFAVEAFNEMKQRAEFILNQKNDLVSAKESLMNTIDEIESRAKEQFMDAFNRARENFIEVFRTLFTAEDTCDLVLTNPESPLESEIEIIAKPKGKRPQTINQLSGGEKTLTAISLLFSLYLLKPAPFCVLDEVDAPLDDANVGKFNDMIRRFSDRSQFILVTHNKATMSAADVLYGVTMQEEGVSRVVPVDFRALVEA